MEFSKKIFGRLSNGKDVWLYTIKAGEITLSISTLGATWTSLMIPSRLHGTDDVLLGFRSFEGYADNTSYFGATIGRFANRISGAKYTFDKKTYFVSENKPNCSLHGGKNGFSRRLWKAEPYFERDGVFIRFELESPDGDQGFPGNLKAAVTYGLTMENKLAAIYEAEVDRPCPVNIINHAYFNLAGESRGMDVLSNELRLNCSSFVEVDKSFIPTGKILPVENTPLDFRKTKELGRDIKSLRDAGFLGYDHCLTIDGKQGRLRPFVEVREPYTGRMMKGLTTLPGVQMYTGNMLKSVFGKNGSVYEKYQGLCLETQYFPDSPNQNDFPSAIFGPGKDYYGKTVFEFNW